MTANPFLCYLPLKIVTVKAPSLITLEYCTMPLRPFHTWNITAKKNIALPRPHWSDYHLSRYVPGINAM